MNEEIDQTTKMQLIDSHGVGYYDFIRKLKPNYAVLWLQLLSGHVALLAIAVALISSHLKFSLGSALIVVLSGLLFGFVFAYIMLFFHEAAHYNIAKGRKLNDLLANIFIGTYFGQDIKDYRPIHYGHHRAHGQIDDSEHAYFDPLNIQFILESLMGIKLLKILLSRKKRLAAMETVPSPKIKVQLIVGLCVNLLVMMSAYYFHSWALCLSWLLGLFIFFPFFAALRPVLEHRSELASATIDYYKVPHGVSNRLFGDGPFASTFGGAGFNRHLLHHWEPKISYTRLKELENYLMDTKVSFELKKRQTTYAQTFLKIFK